MNQKKLTYVTYCTTNDITNEKYYGVFSFDSDRKGLSKYQNYIGQGIIHHNQAPKMKPTEFVLNVCEYHYDNFTREDLLITKSKTEAYRLEELLVNQVWLEDKMSLNNRSGGMNNYKSSLQTRERISKALKLNNHNSKPCYDSVTGKHYKSISEASEDLNIKAPTLRSQIGKLGDNHFIKLI